MVNFASHQYFTYGLGQRCGCWPCCSLWQL